MNAASGRDGTGAGRRSWGSAWAAFQSILARERERSRSCPSSAIASTNVTRTACSRAASAAGTVDGMRRAGDRARAPREDGRRDPAGAVRAAARGPARSCSSRAATIASIPPPSGEARAGSRAQSDRSGSNAGTHGRPASASAIAREILAFLGEHGDPVVKRRRGKHAHATAFVNRERERSPRTFERPSEPGVRRARGRASTSPRSVTGLAPGREHRHEAARRGLRPQPLRGHRRRARATGRAGSREALRGRADLQQVRPLVIEPSAEKPATTTIDAPRSASREPERRRSR
jgi:hypothetical protein